MDSPGVIVLMTLAGAAALVAVVGVTLYVLLDRTFRRSIELATLPDPNSPSRTGTSPTRELDAIREYLSEPVDDARPPAIDPTDWTIPDPERPKVTRVEPGEGLIPR